ncbi:MAG: response regulator transcription factor [Chloroflexota bacterium]|nr:MAG: DNA-binding response regulator [Chloroflexota bacterium]
MRLLLIEDEPKIARFIKRGLEEEHHAVDVADNGEDGIALAGVTPYDLVILDLMLPDTDGVDVCRRLRQGGELVPVLMLTARGTLEDKVTGLDAGADDYLTKPFAFAELLARVRALLRRHEGAKTAQLHVADLTLDTATHDVRRADRRVELSNKEYAVLEYLMRHAGQVVTRTMLLEAVWDYDFHPGSNVVDVYIRYLRRKIDDPFPVKILATLRGSGYRLRAPDDP